MEIIPDSVAATSSRFVSSNASTTPTALALGSAIMHEENVKGSKPQDIILPCVSPGSEANIRSLW